MSDEVNNKIIHHFLKSDKNWSDWYTGRDKLNANLRAFIDDKLRAHSRGVVEFDFLDNKYYIVIKPKIPMQFMSHIIFFKAKGDDYSMLPINDNKPISKSMMMLAFAESVHQK